MHIHRFLVTLAALILGLGLFGAVAPRVRVASAQAAGPSITTDASQYRIGDTAEVCYSVPSPGNVVITDTSADGSSQVILSGLDDGSGGCESGTISGPTGTECLSLAFQAGSISQSAGACFQVTQAAGPCADPAGNCPNNGQAAFPPAGSSSIAAGTGPCADPSNNCPNHGQVTFSQGGGASGSQGTPQTGGQPPSQNQPSQPQSSTQPASSSAANPTSIAGHYQCSSELLVGFGGQPCTYEPVLVLNGDGSYEWGTEQGTYMYDGSTVTFSGTLGAGTVHNRLLVIDSQTTDPNTGDAMTIRYRYIRMNY
jgi:hypothetical protein